MREKKNKKIKSKRCCSRKGTPKTESSILITDQETEVLRSSQQGHTVWEHNDEVQEVERARGGARDSEGKVPGSEAEIQNSGLDAEPQWVKLLQVKGDPGPSSEPTVRPSNLSHEGRGSLPGKHRAMSGRAVTVTYFRYLGCAWQRCFPGSL